MKRAKLRGRKRNAAVALENVGTEEDVPMLERTLDDEEPLAPAAPLLAQARTGAASRW